MGFRGIHQLLILIYMATAGGFPRIPVRNGRKERGVDFGMRLDCTGKHIICVNVLIM